MSEPSTASIDREPGSVRTDAERITEAGITDALVECLREGGYGECELLEESSFVVREIREVAERKEPDELLDRHQVFRLPTETCVNLFLQGPGGGRAMARFYYENPYPNNSSRKPFFMLREYESTVREVEPEKRPPMGIVAAGLSEPQLRLIKELRREYRDKIRW